MATGFADEAIIPACESWHIHTTPLKDANTQICLEPDMLEVNYCGGFDAMSVPLQSGCQI